jgi:ketosteroid isomerase-like protein
MNEKRLKHIINNLNLMNIKQLKLLPTVILIFVSLLGYSQESYEDILDAKYVPIDHDVYDIIVAKDKEYFDAYNTCDMNKQASLFSEDLEFFHDKGGLSTSKQEILSSIEKNICHKVTRTLIDGSIEVYPIHNYGAIEIGYHKFYNNQEPNARSKPSKFIMVWKNEGGKWLIAKVISLH